MYIRMGPTDDQKDKLHLDGILIYNRERALEYVDQIRSLIEVLWPPKQEEEK
jgi:hypothetical protein